MKPIQAGDLVMVMHRCCDSVFPYGFVATVKNVIPTTLEPMCRRCKTICADNGLAEFDKANPIGSRYPLSWLRRIDPLPSDETQDNQESMPA